jgi:hypothetical protein
MIEKLRNQERLSEEQERRIEIRIRNAVLALIAVAVVVIIIALMRGMKPGNWYYALILAVLGSVWVTRYVLSAVWKRALAQRTDEQVSAYLKAAGLELAAYAGLGWFLIGLNGNAIIGAVIYVIAVTAARKQKDLYYGEPAVGNSPAPAGNLMEEQDGRMDAKNASIKNVSMENLPSAADRLMREKESEDGSV